MRTGGSFGVLSTEEKAASRVPPQHWASIGTNRESAINEAPAAKTQKPLK